MILGNEGLGVKGCKVSGTRLDTWALRMHSSGSMLWIEKILEVRL